MLERPEILFFIAFTLFAAVGCGYQGAETTIVLQNSGDRDLYIQEFEWADFEADGEKMVFDATCMTKCTVAGGFQEMCAMGMRMPTVAEMEPGDTRHRKPDRPEGQASLRRRSGDV